MLNTFSFSTTSIFSPPPFSPFLSSHPSFYNNLLIIHKLVQLQSIFHISREQIWQKPQSPDENPLWLSIFRIKFKLAVLLYQILPDLIPAFSRPTSITCSFMQYIFMEGVIHARQWSKHRVHNAYPYTALYSPVSAVLNGFKLSNVSCFLKMLSTAIFTLFSLSHSFLYFLCFVLYF